MSPERWRDRAQHIIDASTAIQRLLEGKTEADFVVDALVTSAVAYQITIIGEATGHIPPEIRDRHPEVPWPEMRAMRNLLAHRYFRLDAGILWDTAVNDVPPLVPLLQHLLETEP